MTIMRAAYVDLAGAENGMKTSAKQRDRNAPLETATYGLGDYGRVAQRDGSERWWIRSHGTWIALRHQRVMENDDGSITLLLLRTEE